MDRSVSRHPNKKSISRNKIIKNNEDIRYLLEKIFYNNNMDTKKSALKMKQTP